MRAPRWTGVLLLVATAAGAQVPCDDPDNLCTGDPCVIPSVEVLSPCVVDFGARALVVDGRLGVPNAGVLSLSAASIDVEGSIAGSHTRRTEGDGADLTLIATGALMVRAPVRASGRASAGTITLQAGGQVEVGARLQATATGPGAAGGAVSVEAGGLLVMSRRGPAVLVYGNHRADTAGGQAVLRGTAGVTVAGTVDARGLTGGSIELSSAMGSVVADGRLLAAGREGVGGDVTLAGDTGVTLNGRVDADGRTSGGSLDVSSGAGDVTLNGDLSATGADVGGTVNVDAAGAATLNAAVEVDARGGTGGELAVGAGSASVGPYAALTADGDAGGGSVRLEVSAGDLALAGVFFARGGGGVIAGTASGTLTASGDFRVAPAGCIGLSGSSVDTSGGTFDAPIQPSCP